MWCRFRGVLISGSGCGGLSLPLPSHAPLPSPHNGPQSQSTEVSTDSMSLSLSLSLHLRGEVCWRQCCIQWSRCFGLAFCSLPLATSLGPGPSSPPLTESCELLPHNWQPSHPLPLPRLTVPDLTPNVGLFWYFFTEAFEHFRVFFLCVFQINAFLYVLPLSVRFRSALSPLSVEH